VRVIGLGNPEAGDDALGLIAIRELRARCGDAPDVELIEAGPAHRIIDLLDDVDAVVVVDAVRTRGGRRKAGAIVRAELGVPGALDVIESSLSSHGFGLAEMVGLAAALRSDARMVFFGIEVADVTTGKRLSSAVETAMPRLLEMIESELSVLRRPNGD
jgi:hydrogenase maturation protease